MGYFSNVMEEAFYQKKYCEKCIHDEPGCAVWKAQVFRNYDECNNGKSILHMLIPMGEIGVNRQCKMFIERR